MQYIDVILPIPLEGTFTYHVSDDMEGKVCIGGRVIVPFGTAKCYTGIVTAIHKEKPQVQFALKDIVEVLDSQPSVLPQQLELWKWVSQYYMCSVGDVFKAALPSGMKLESETQLILQPEFDNWQLLTKRETEILELLQRKTFKNVSQIQKETKDKSIISILRSLMKKEALVIKEEIKDTFKPKKEKHIRLAKKYLDEPLLNELAQSLEKQTKRYALLMKLVEMQGVAAALTLHNNSLLKEVSRADLLKEADVSSAVLLGMVAKGYLEAYDYEIGRLKVKGKSITEQLPLTDAQQEAYNAIQQSFQKKQVCLLHGVTSSGKTEIYIRLIREQLEKGNQVLYLLPEIALTTQITKRLERIFGDKLGVYHSKYPDNERVEIWNKQLSSHPYQLILGARSSLFLPFQKLGLVIVDEEHETSYKQQDPAPRYNARDTAIVLAGLYHAKVLLGTATPSLETYHNTQTGKYAYIPLMQRYGNMQLPKIEVVDLKDLLRRKVMALPFSPRLREEMEKAFQNGEQVILFQNRRGYTPVIECKSCGWNPRCQFCDVTLTYHHEIHKLVCHYCGSQYDVVQKCPNCGETEMRSMGFGTEKIEEEVQKIFPQVRTARLDLDTTRSRNSYEKILNDFAQHKTDVLIGTQMVSKGLDFDNVHVVGILDADTMLTRPDFRAYERAFQMMAQVAGRAGRRNKQGYVILQTKNAESPVIQQIISNDYRAMYEEQKQERQDFMFPPYCRLIYIYLKHKESQVVSDAAMRLAVLLKQSFGDNLLGPDQPVIGRIQMQYIRKLMVKIVPEYSTQQAKEIIEQAARKIIKNISHGSVNIYFDVDPLQ